MKTQQEREAERRRQKLDAVEEQKKSGSLTVRQMTPEEKEKYGPPKPRAPKKR